jgi:hypothetical protein
LFDYKLKYKKAATKGAENDAIDLICSKPIKMSEYCCEGLKDMKCTASAQIGEKKRLLVTYTKEHICAKLVSWHEDDVKVDLMEWKEENKYGSEHDRNY